jgi:hypothetical protein
MSGILLAALLALDQVSPSVTLQPPVVEERSSFTPVVKEDAVLRWNELVLQAIRTDRTPPPTAARNLAMVHVAVYDAVNAVTRTHEYYLTDVRPVPEASPTAAAAAAAHRVLIALYPRQKRTLDDALTASLAEVAGQGRESGAQLGEFVADRVLEWRQGDGSDNAGKYVPKTGLGMWRPTGPDFRPALLPEWSRVRPFAVRDVGRFRPPGPPPLGSPAYVAAFREVRSLGSRDSRTRTAEQSDIAFFWADDVGTSTPPGHWNRIAQEASRGRGLSLAENARLFALLNISLADAALVCWSCKFSFELWRPITAIRESSEDAVAAAPADPEWIPLLTTPPFPAYTSGHSTFSGAGAAALARYFGTDRVSFTTTSEGLPGVRRSFETFSAAAAEAGMSRIYGGIHWQHDNVDGLAIGRAVGEYVCRNALRVRQPEPAPAP